MTEQRELRISFEDLVNLVVECECGAEVSINLTKKEASEADWQTRAPLVVPSVPESLTVLCDLEFLVIWNG